MSTQFKAPIQELFKQLILPSPHYNELKAPNTKPSMQPCGLQTTSPSYSLPPVDGQHHQHGEP